METCGTCVTQVENARAGRHLYFVSLRDRTAAIAAEGGFPGGLGAPVSAENLGLQCKQKREFFVCKVFFKTRIYRNFEAYGV